MKCRQTLGFPGLINVLVGIGGRHHLVGGLGKHVKLHLDTAPSERSAGTQYSGLVQASCA